MILSNACAAVRYRAPKGLATATRALHQSGGTTPEFVVQDLHWGLRLRQTLGNSWWELGFSSGHLCILSSWNLGTQKAVEKKISLYRLGR